jgi:hypothetical protein
MLRGRQPCEVDHARRGCGARRGEGRGRAEKVDCERGEGDEEEGVMKVRRGRSAGWPQKHDIHSFVLIA